MRAGTVRNIGAVEKTRREDEKNKDETAKTSHSQQERN